MQSVLPILSLKLNKWTGNAVLLRMPPDVAIPENLGEDADLLNVLAQHSPKK